MQTSYSQSPPIAAEGALASASGGYEQLLPAISLDTNGAIKFGRAVRVATAPAGDGLAIVELPNATGEVTGDTFYGVSVRDGTIENSDADSFNGYATGETLTVMRRGTIWVISEDAVTAVGTPAFVRFTAEAPDLDIGSFRTDADTDKAVALPGALFMSTCAAGGLVKLELAPQ